MSVATRYVIGSIIVLVSTTLLFYLISLILFEIIITSEVRSFIEMWDMESPSYFLGAFSSGILYTLLFITIGLVETLYKFLKNLLPPEVNNNYIWIAASILMAYLIYTTIFDLGAEDRISWPSLERLQFIIYAVFFVLLLNNLNKNLGQIFALILLYAVLSAILISAIDLLITKWDRFNTFVLIEYLLKGFVVLTSLSITVRYIKPIELNNGKKLTEEIQSMPVNKSIRDRIER